MVKLSPVLQLWLVRGLSLMIPLFLFEYGSTVIGTQAVPSVGMSWFKVGGEITGFQMGLAFICGWGMAQAMVNAIVVRFLPAGFWRSAWWGWHHSSDAVSSRPGIHFLVLLAGALIPALLGMTVAVSGWAVGWFIVAGLVLAWFVSEVLTASSPQKLPLTPPVLPRTWWLTSSLSWIHQAALIFWPVFVYSLVEYRVERVGWIYTAALVLSALSWYFFTGRSINHEGVSSQLANSETTVTIRYRVERLVWVGIWLIRGKMLLMWPLLLSETVASWSSTTQGSSQPHWTTLAATPGSKTSPLTSTKTGANSVKNIDLSIFLPIFLLEISAWAIALGCVVIFSVQWQLVFLGAAVAVLAELVIREFWQYNSKRYG